MTWPARSAIPLDDTPAPDCTTSPVRHAGPGSS